MKPIRNRAVRRPFLVALGLLLLPGVFLQANATVRCDSGDISTATAVSPLTAAEAYDIFYTVDDLSQDSVPADKRPYTFSEAIELRRSVLKLAAAQIGTPYFYGGACPGGFDCSGFVYYIYGRLGFSLRRCADDQLSNGIPVSKKNLQPGDLVFFRDPDSPWLASHVGIYVGDSRMIHASASNGIVYSSLDMEYYASRYVGARRIINVDTTEISRLPSAVSAAATQSVPMTHSIGVRSVP